MFKDPHALPQKKVKARNPQSPQPSYDSRKQMYPSGDNYGTGFRAKVGKMRAGSPSEGPIPQKSMRVAPESVV